MRVNWFSPLPPTTDVAAVYAARLLPFLKARADVLLWTHQAQWDRALERWAEVQEFRPEEVPWEELNQGDATLYHFGSDPAANALLSGVLQCHPGIVFWHDGCGSCEALDRALGVIVSSPETFRTLKERQRWPLLLAPLPWAEPDSGLSHALSDYKSHAEMLLTFADEARWFCQRLTAHDLSLKVAREMKLWTLDAGLAAELPRAAREIHILTNPRTPAVADKKARAA
jgi:hypothetical protein